MRKTTWFLLALVAIVATSCASVLFFQRFLTREETPYIEYKQSQSKCVELQSSTLKTLGGIIDENICAIDYATVTTADATGFTLVIKPTKTSSNSYAKFISDNLVKKGWKELQDSDTQSSISTFSNSGKIFTMTRDITLVISLQEIKSRPSDNDGDNNSEDKEINVTSEEIQWGDRTKKQVIFTFDGGAGTQSLEPILTALEKHKLTGTFFLTGRWATTNREDIRRVSDAGHEIFNHTYNHPYLTELSDKEIQKELRDTEETLKSITGHTTKPFFRPPYGDRDDRVRKIAAAEGYNTVYWSYDAMDWKESEGVTASEVYKNVIANLQPGTIYLMHIGDNITGEILEDLFNEIKKQGYTIIPLSKGLAN